jgi:nitrogen fixation NifU-like protein
MYSKKVLKHFLHPKFFGKIKNADGIGKAGNPLCGDVMELYIKIKNQKSKIKNSNERIIKDIRFHTTGCAAAIASSDMICEMVKGKKIKDALKIKFEDIIKKLGKLPPVKVHCSVLATQALKSAIDNYNKKN